MAQSVECFSSVHRALGSTACPHDLDMGSMPVVPSTPVKAAAAAAVLAILATQLLRNARAV